MRNPRLATRYAKSIMDLAQERGQVKEVHESIDSLAKAIGENRELALLFKSPIIKSDAKSKMVAPIMDKLGSDELTRGFVNLVIAKKRDFFLAEILVAFQDLYKEQNNIATVNLTVAHDLAPELRTKLEQAIKSQLEGKEIDLHIDVKESLIGGFVLESNNKMFDASIARDLKDIKSQFMKNIYVPNIK